jgi:peptidyl-prolyl cis-trans isomerase SurA
MNSKMIKKIYILILLPLLIFCKSIALENKIILKINNDIITSIDVLNEMSYLKFFNNSLTELKDEEIYKIAVQSIIKFKIKKNEINKQVKNTSNINEEYLNLLIENRYKQLGFKNLSNFKEKLDYQNIDFEYFKDKILIDIIWNEIIFIKYKDKLLINEDQLRKKLENQKNYEKKYKLLEIVYQIKNTSEADKIYASIIEDINELGFENAALKHSVSSTASNGGNLGWVDERILNKDILETLNEISINSISQPIRISGGFLILKKEEEKIVESKINIEEELSKLINYEKNEQLNNFSNLYYNKVKKDVVINAP